MAVCGLAILLTPLALWAAWSKTAFLAVLFLGGTAALLYCLLAGSRDPAAPRRPLHDRRIPRAPGADREAPHGVPEVRRRRASYPDEMVRMFKAAMFIADDVMALALLVFVWLLVRF